MPQDAYSLYHNAKELNNLLISGKINKITMPNCEDVCLNIYTKCGNFKLIISANANKCRISLTDTEKENPLTPFNFCMLLRKHLTGSEIKEISLCGFERIVKIVFLSKNDFFESEKTIFVEIMGKYSNIFLTEEGKILGALKTASIEESSKRMLLTGAIYKFPPMQDKIEPKEKDKFICLINNFKGDDFAKYLFENIKGIAYITATQIVNGYQNDIVNVDTELFYAYFYDFIYSNNINPCVNIINGIPTDYYVKGNGLAFNTINGAQNYFYTQKEINQNFNGLKKRLNEKVKSIEKKDERKLAIIFEKQKDCSDIEKNRIKGELLLSNLYNLKNGMESCKLENYYEENSVLEIRLDKNLTITDNAQKYFKKYNKQKKTLTAIAPQLEETLSELNYYKSIYSEIETAENFSDLNEIQKELEALSPIKKKENKKPVKKQAESKPKEFIIENFVIKAGRNNLQNDKLLTSSKPNDLWFHTKAYHSSHIIIECLNSKPTDNIIQIAAEICAYNSQGKTGDKIPVDYCLKKYVKKLPKSKPGFVIYTDFKTCYVTPNAHNELIIKKIK
jgi:predicted ribosome quality control (RQC) complex YloA/Tae2 family protein